MKRVVNPSDDDPEMPFRIENRNYTKREIACLYAPMVKPESAGRRLRDWIARCPDLEEQLELSRNRRGAGKRCQHFTPAEVRLIMRLLNPPECMD